MRKNIFTIQEMYLTGFEYIFVKKYNRFDYTFARNTRISDEDIIETDQIHLLYCGDIHSPYLFYVCQLVKNLMTCSYVTIFFLQDVAAKYL